MPQSDGPRPTPVTARPAAGATRPLGRRRPVAGGEPAVASVAAHEGASRDMCEVRCIDAPTVTRVRAEMPSGAAVALAAERLKLLGDPTRLRLLAALARADELCVCDLTLIVGTGGPAVSESAVSHALRGLRLAGMVAYRKQQKVAYYRLADAAARQLVADVFAAANAVHAAAGTSAVPTPGVQKWA